MSEERDPGDTGYVCERCGLPVTPVNGALVRSCLHTDAKVIATMEAEVFGEGGADNGA